MDSSFYNPPSVVDTFALKKITSSKIDEYYRQGYATKCNPDGWNVMFMQCVCTHCVRHL